MSRGDFVRRGKIDEMFVAKHLLMDRGGNVIPATQDEDIFNLVFWWRMPDAKAVGVNVKGVKECGRHDLRPDNDITRLKIQNVYAQPRWSDFVIKVK